MAIPKVCRVMRKGNDDLPVVDATGKGLGVRGIPVNGVADVDLDGDGTVIANGKGMSVAPALKDLPHYLIPMRLKDRFPRARALSEYHCFRLGEGPFQDGPVSEGLLLHCDKPTHGLVIPERPVSLDEFQGNLAKTRALWEIDEA